MNQKVGGSFLGGLNSRGTLLGWAEQWRDKLMRRSKSGGKLSKQKSIISLWLPIVY
jgi:hypothetical protein